MKTLLMKILAAMMLAAALAGCSTMQQESAMEWMQRQPWSSDDTT